MKAASTQWRCLSNNSLLVLSLIAATFFNFKAGAQGTGISIFNSPVIHEVKLTFWQNNFWDSLVQNYLTDTYMRCRLEFNGTVYDTIGVKFKGNSSYNNPGDKKPFKLDINDYNSTFNLDGLKKINLNNGFKDPSFLREKVFLDFCKNAGIIAPRCTYAKVYLNNAYWGLYTLVEEVDKTFLNDRFSDNDGNLFKGDPSGDLKWLGPNASNYYSKYELHTNETANDWSDLINLIKEINNSGPAFYDSLESLLNTGDFIKGWAATEMFVNLDSYIGSGHNYFIYHNLSTGKFEWILWDTNEAFGNFTMGLQPNQILSLPYDYVNQPANRPLVNNMKLQSAYLSLLKQEVCNFLDWFNATGTMSYIDSLANAIRPSVYSDNHKYFTNQQFEDNILQDISVPGNPGGSNIMGIKSFITARLSQLSVQTNYPQCLSAVDESLQKPYSVWPNPCQGYLYFTPTVTDGTCLIYDITGKQQSNGYIRNGCLDIRSLEKGIYVIRLTHPDNPAWIRVAKI